MPLTKDQAIELLLGVISAENKEEASKVEEKAEPKAEPKQEEKAEPKEEKQEKPKEDEAKAKEEAEKAKAEAEKLSQKENQIIDSKVSSGFSEAGFDKDTISGLKEFIAYDKLKNDSGEADDEKIKNFLEILTSAALRKPPRSNEGLEDLSGEADGFGKYLRKK